MLVLDQAGDGEGKNEVELSRRSWASPAQGMKRACIMAARACMMMAQACGGAAQAHSQSAGDQGKSGKGEQCPTALLVPSKTQSPGDRIAVSDRHRKEVKPSCCGNSTVNIITRNACQTWAVHGKWMASSCNPFNKCDGFQIFWLPLCNCCAFSERFWGLWPEKGFGRLGRSDRDIMLEANHWSWVAEGRSAAKKKEHQTDLLRITKPVSDFYQVPVMLVRVGLWKSSPCNGGERGGPPG